MSERIYAAIFALAALGPAAAMATPPLTTPANSEIAAPSAPRFAAYAIGHERAMVTLGRLAERRGAEPGVRHFAHTLRVDNERAIARMTRVADNDHITLPSPNGETERTVRELQNLHGRAFDRAFLRDVVRRLLRARHDYRVEVAATHGDISKLAGGDLPAIHKHLSAALKLEPVNERPRGM